MSQLQLLEELGRGNYGTVKKVLHKPTNVLMAMKEIRLELDATKLNAILMELDILHRAVAHEIVEFYGAFFIESCVYYCMEFMDAGSVDKLQEGGIPEGVLARVAHSMVRGLKFLKDEMQIIHRGPYRTRLPDSASLTLTCFHLSRRKTNERPSKQARRREALRFRCLGSTRKVTGKNEYRVSKLHGSKHGSHFNLSACH